MEYIDYNISSRMRECSAVLEDWNVALKLASFANEVSCLEARHDLLGKQCRSMFTEVFTPDSEFDLPSFAERLRFALEQRGGLDNCAEWCAEHDISPTSMNGFLNARGAPQLATFFKLCRELDASPAWLLGLGTYRNAP